MKKDHQMLGPLFEGGNRHVVMLLDPEFHMLHANKNEIELHLLATTPYAYAHMDKRRCYAYTSL